VIVALVALGTVLLVANAAFVGAEFALVASRLAQLRQLAQAGDLRAAMAVRQAEKLPSSLASLQLGITAASIGLGFTTEVATSSALVPTLERLFPAATLVVDAAVAALALGVVVSLHTLLGEMVPKNLAIAAPESTARWLSLPTAAIRLVTRPLVPLVTGSVTLLLRPFGLVLRDEREIAHSNEEIGSMLEISRAEGALNEYDGRLLSRILAFSNTRAVDAMVDWTRMDTVPETATFLELERAFALTGRGRLPLRASAGQRIVGYVKSCDLGLVGTHRQHQPIPPSLIRGTVEVGESLGLVTVLEQMRKAGRHFAVVAAPDGTTLGIVTMRQVIEVLIGAGATAPTEPRDPA
jgi:CBS domain containing-hemolysin-like protein